MKNPLRICSRCHTELRLADFGGNPNRCKPCRAEAWRFAMAEKRDREAYARRLQLQRLIGWPPPGVERHGTGMFR